MASKRRNIDGEETEKLSPQKITIMTTGSRGDIQPFVAIGFALKKAGYTVRVLTNPSKTHAMLLKDFDLTHVPFGIDVDAFLKDDKDARKSMETGDTLKFFGCIASVIDDHTLDVCKPFANELRDHRPDLLLVSYLNRYFGLHAKHVCSIPSIEIRLQHWAFDNPARAPMGMPTLPLGMHKLIQTKIMIPQDYKNFKKFNKCLSNILVSENEGGRCDHNWDNTEIVSKSTSCLDDFLLYDQLYESEVSKSPLLPTIVCQSPLLQDVLHPTSRMLRFVGSAIIEQTDQIATPGAGSFGCVSERKELECFLSSNAGQKPVYMGWGSMIRKSTQEMSIFAIETLMRSEQKGIILGGAAGLNMEVLEAAVDASTLDNNQRQDILQYAKQNVMFVERAPHEWLFPQVSMTIHHGGAGTLNAALRAGVPTIVTPIFGDQYDHSFAVNALGVGIGFEQQLQKISVDNLSKAITTIANDPIITNRAKEVGEIVQSENGSNAIVEQVKKYWAEEVSTKSFYAEITDWKIITKEKKSSNDRRNLFQRVVFTAAIVVAGLSFLMK